MQLRIWKYSIGSQKLRKERNLWVTLLSRVNEMCWAYCAVRIITYSQLSRSQKMFIFSSIVVTGPIIPFHSIKWRKIFCPWLCLSVSPYTRSRWKKALRFKQWATHWYERSFLFIPQGTSMTYKAAFSLKGLHGVHRNGNGCTPISRGKSMRVRNPRFIQILWMSLWKHWCLIFFKITHF